MGKIKRIITAEEREQVRQKEAEKIQERENLKQRFSQTAKPSQADINELVLVLAREHGLLD